MKVMLGVFILILGLALLSPSQITAENCVPKPGQERNYQSCLQGLGPTPQGSDVEACVKAYTVCGDTVSNPANDPATESDSSVTKVFGTIKVPDQIASIGLGFDGLKNIIKTGVNLAFLFGGLLCFAFVIWGAIDIIGSGAQKEGMAEGRKKITYALFGLALLSLSFVIIRVVAYVLGLDGVLSFSST